MLDFGDIGQYQENNRLEAKMAVGGFPHSLWETYSAFANTLGGIILLGVEELPDKSFHAVQLPDAQMLVDTFWQQVNNKKIASVNLLKPEQVRIVQVDGKPIVLIEVPCAAQWQRPVYVGGDMYQGTYRRTGEGDYRCTRQEVERMLQQQQAHTFATDDEWEKIQLVQYITDHVTINVFEAAKLLQCSVWQAWRILRQLQRENILERVHWWTYRLKR